MAEPRGRFKNQHAAEASDQIAEKSTSSQTLRTQRRTENVVAIQQTSCQFASD